MDEKANSCDMELLKPEKITHSFSINVYPSKEDLNQNDSQLINYAVAAQKRAYAPYSNFPVGTAIELENGKIIEGNNQENAAYPSGLCAERVALFHCAASYPNIRINSIAITANCTDPITPCGACRQVISEYEQKQGTPIRLIMNSNGGKVYISENIANLLPLAFQLTI